LFDQVAVLGERFALERAPPVYALGNQARTMACLPRKSDSLYVFPFDACSEKSGAASPIFRSPAAEGAADHTKPTRPIAAIVRALVVPPDERPPVAAVLSLAEHPFEFGQLRVVQIRDGPE